MTSAVQIHPRKEKEFKIREGEKVMYGCTLRIFGEAAENSCILFIVFRILEVGVGVLGQLEGFLRK